MVELSPTLKHSEPSQTTATMNDAPDTESSSSKTSTATPQLPSSDGELVNFIVAVFRLLVIATFAFFRMGSQSFARAVGSPVVGDALRILADELQYAATDPDVPNTIANERGSCGIDKVSQTKDEDEISDKVIAVSCGLRVGVFNDW